MAVLIIVSLLEMGLLLIKPDKANAAWFDDNYAYRQKITFTHNADITSDRRVTITIDTATLITDGKMQSSCADSRFTDTNGKVLRYQLTGTCSNASTTYDIVFPVIYNGTNTGYFYYGNPSAVSASDPTVAQVTSLSPSGGSPSVGSEEKGTPPVLHWSFDEGYGTTANDGTSYANNGIVNSSSAWQPEDMCVIGECLTFNGSSDKVTKTYLSDKELDPGTDGMTISSWFRHPASASGTQTIIDRFSTTGYKLYMNSSGNMCFAISDATHNDSTCTSDAYNDNTWHFVEGVRDTTNTKINMYIDGNLIKQITLTATATISGSSITLSVGVANAGNNFWNGFLDEVKVYNYAKSAAQIQTDFINRGGLDQAGSSFGNANPSNTLTNGLVGYWKMDESSGSPADSSGNAYTLTNNNTTAFAVGKFANASSYDGTTQYFSTATTISGVQTISFWVNPASNTNNYINLNGSTYVTSSAGAVSATGVASPSIYVNGILNGTVIASVWNHVVITTGTAISGSSFEVGRANGSYLTNTSKMDDVRIYNRTLADREVRSLYDWAPGPVGWWKLDENSGTTANDTSGNGNTGTLSNPTWTTGIYGTALNFNGTGDQVTASTNSTLAITGDVTVSAWVKRSTASDLDTIATYDAIGETQATNILYRLRINNANNLSFSWEAGSGTDQLVTSSTTVSPTSGSWVYYSAVRDSVNKQVTFYQNGVRLGTVQTYTNNPDGGSTSSLVIGNSNTGAGAEFGGKIDDVRIYNYMRTSKQIISDMNGGHPAVGSPVGPAVGYWGLDEGYGTTANNTGSCGSTCNGTLSGSTKPSWTNSGKLGKALSFPHSNQAYVTTMGNPAALRITGALTLSAWVNLTTNNIYNAVIGKEGAVGNWSYDLYTDINGKAVLEVSGSGSNTKTVTGSTTLQTGTWYHITGVYIPSTSLTIYVNGKQDGQNTSSVYGSLFDSTATVEIGSQNGGATNYMSGLIDEPKIYNYALNADEIKLEYSQGKSLVLGSLSTASDGTTLSNGQDRTYCVPGDTSTCNPPIGEWKLDEGTGTAANDTSGNALTGTWNGTGAHWGTGKIGSAGTFNGASDYIDINGHLDFLSTDSFTAQAWVYSTSNSTQVIIGKGDGFSNAWSMQLSSGRLNWWQKDSSNTVQFNGVATNLLNGSWHMVTGVRDRTNNIVKLYIDGVFYASATDNTSGDFNRNANAQIGQTNNSEYFNGALDEIKIYNYARTPAQIAWDYNRGGPLGWWQFDECTGTTLYDNSGSGKNGTLTPGAGTNTSAGTCSSGTSSEIWNNGTTGKFNASLDFDGTDDLVNIAPSVLPTGDFTYSVWEKFNGVASTRTLLMAYGNASNDNEFRLRLASGVLEVALNNSTVLTGTTAVSNAVWHHIVVTRSGSTVTLYIDGRVEGTGSDSSTLDFGTCDLFIGADSDSCTGGVKSGPMKGQLDDVRIYNYALTPLQIKLLYNGDAAVKF